MGNLVFICHRRADGVRLVTLYLGLGMDSLSIYLSLVIYDILLTTP